MNARLSYTLAEVSEVTGIGLTTVKAAVKNGDLEAHYPTSKAVIMRDELEAWLKSLPTSSPFKKGELA